MTPLPQLDRFISLSQAARRLGLAKDTLRSLIDSGRIKGAVLPNGDIGVSEPELGSIVTHEQFEHLRGQPITVVQTVAKYQIKPMTIRGWIERGYITILKQGYGMTIDECDVAYCVAVYRSVGGTPGKRIFDESGRPYQLQKPEFAEYKREWRKKKKRLMRPPR
jgi:hypothetical protein